MEQVILASQNRDKIREMDAILAKFGMKAVPRDDAGLPDFEIEETGETLEENSYLKAKTILDLSGLPTIADDTGLLVDVLGGAPGVYAARWAGENCTYADNNRKMLRELAGVPAAQRTAKFVTVITMLFPDGTKIVARGECPGRIAEEFRGDAGFGYDPLFIPEGYECTFAEMGPEVKNRISHRAKALEKLEERIREREI
ncbi:MAG: RdgB/HAM1 family non-canonical purine NTP pyrophosphatase [Mogibacterium sp.]|nr:RdgB/HAM1 family non-canonical purine NTP pyrophosphatase [Mogibacterium sp.]